VTWHEALEFGYHDVSIMVFGFSSKPVGVGLVFLDEFVLKGLTKV